MTTTLAAGAGTFDVGGDLAVNRLGFGAMQLTGPGVWGDPDDPAECIRVLQRAVELGVNFIDTADSYGPYVSEDLIYEALHPYPEGLVIATKAGFTRAGPGDWRAVGRPEYLRQACLMSMRRLGVDVIDLFQLHRIDRKVPMEEQVGELKLLREEGKIRHIGLSQVSVKEVEAAQKIAPIATVQNLYNLSKRDDEELLDWCTSAGIGFILWFPLATGRLAGSGGVLDELSAKSGHSPAQLALAWLLNRSPVMLPIPGTSKVAHLEDNLKAAAVELTDEQFESLSDAA